MSGASVLVRVSFSDQFLRVNFLLQRPRRSRRGRVRHGHL